MCYLACRNATLPLILRPSSPRSIWITDRILENPYSRFTTRILRRNHSALAVAELPTSFPTLRILESHTATLLRVSPPTKQLPTQVHRLGRRPRPGWSPEWFCSLLQDILQTQLGGRGIAVIACKREIEQLSLKVRQQLVTPEDLQCTLQFLRNLEKGPGIDEILEYTFSTIWRTIRRCRSLLTFYALPCQ